MVAVLFVAVEAAADGGATVTREDVERQLIAIAHEAHTDPEAATDRERRMLPRLAG